MKKIVIIGAGASGLFAAILLGKNLKENANIVLIEHCDKVGRKLLATGNGRCNLTNKNLNISRFHMIDLNGFDQMKNILLHFDQNDCINFFESIGVACVEEADGKIYPASGQASAVLDLLRIECDRFNVEQKCNCHVESVEKNNHCFRIKIREYPSIQADYVILATGGQAAPKLGSDISGYSILNKWGHHSTKRFPSITSINAITDEIKNLRGIKTYANVKLVKDITILHEEYGEVLFTDYGLSGPPILQISGYAGKAWINEPNVQLNIYLNLLNQLSFDELLLKLQLRLAEQGYKIIYDFLTGWINKQIARSLLKSLNIASGRISYSLSQSELKAIAFKLQNWKIPILSNRDFNFAQATGGGVKLCEFDSNLQSLYCDGLYVTGEILDVCGDSGGFNLQWAWSSAFTAAQGIIKHSLTKNL